MLPPISRETVEEPPTAVSTTIEIPVVRIRLPGLLTKPISESSSTSRQPHCSAMAAK